MALGSGLSLFSPPMRTMAFRAIREWQFREPVYVGDTLRVLARVLAKEPRARGRRGIITWERKIINQERKVVQEGVSVTLVEGRGGQKEGAAGDAAAPTADAAPEAD
jgi:acyl dehydratase